MSNRLNFPPIFVLCVYFFLFLFSVLSRSSCQYLVDQCQKTKGKLRFLAYLSCAFDFSYPPIKSKNVPITSKPFIDITPNQNQRKPPNMSTFLFGSLWHFFCPPLLHIVYTVYYTTRHEENQFADQTKTNVYLQHTYLVYEEGEANNFA